MSKAIKIVVSICFVLIYCNANLSYKVQAEDDFEINEREYIERCKSSEMSKKDVEICSQFNEYLKTKNENLKNSMSGLKDSISNTEIEISGLQDEIALIDSQIQSKQEEINYAADNINTLTTTITELETTLKNRLYAMQAYSNSNQFFTFILGATSFSDLFSRIEGVNQLTSHDKDLLRRLSNTKEENESQKLLMEDSKQNLASLQDQKNIYQEQLNSQLATLTEQLGYVETEMKLTEPIINELNNAVASSKASIAEEEAYQQWLQDQLQKPSNPNNGGNNNSGGNNQNPDNGDNSNPDNDNNPNPDGGNDGSGEDNGGNDTGGDTTELGLELVSTAWSQRGSPYVWGGKGQYITAQLINNLSSYYGPSWYTGLSAYYDTNTRAFDCSGLTNWVYSNYGIFVGWSTLDQQVRGYEVSWANMQPGDLILFDWDYDGRTDHVGMYAGNNMMVHTSTPNDGLGVHMINLNASSTWYNHCYTIRRYI